jgi:hypothetical protein
MKQMSLWTCDSRCAGCDRGFESRLKHGRILRGFMPFIVILDAFIQSELLFRKPARLHNSSNQMADNNN